MIADTVRYDPEGDRLIASGNVQIFFEGRVLSARTITYLNADGDILVEGPLTLKDASGTTLIAESAELDAELKSGLLHGARLVLAENFQFAATNARRVNGRYTSLERTVASACKICNHTDTPVWQIRANRIVHDEVEKRVHFEGARFELLGVPIAYFPYFYAPDPSVSRASGFLTPQFRNSDIFGFGVRVPYFYVLDANRDLTVTPFLTSRGANVLEGEYRQRFTNGDLDITGAVAIDDNPALPKFRAYVDADAEFRLKNNYIADFAVNWASDNAFLNEYGYSSSDRLTSSASLSRTTQTERFQVDIVGFQSLRDGVNDRTLPFLLPQISYEQYWDDPILGGQVSVQADALALGRIVGRDVFSLGGALAWRGDRILPGGVVGTIEAELDGRMYATGDDPAFPSGPKVIGRPAAALELRWPFSRTKGTTVQVIEPVVQLVYSDVWGDETQIPNEDSVQLEFDAANLFSINRFPGNDRSETGFRANVGMTFKQISQSGWNYSATLGQVFRDSKSTVFPAATGLNDLSSNLVAATNIEFPPYFSVANQTILSNSLNFERNDIQMGLNWDNLDLNASFVYLAADPGAGALTDRQELTVDGRYQFLPNWAVDFNWRRDLATDDNVSAAAGLEYGNECIRSRFSVSRRFTNSNSLPSSTEFGFTVSLAGLGGSTEKWPADQCSAP